MAFLLIIRRKNKYVRCLAIFVIIYACFLIIGDHVRLSLTQGIKFSKNWHAAEAKTAHQFLNKTADTNNTFSERANTREGVNSSDGMQSSYHVTYSETEIQVQIKAIHEHGEKTINLQHDKCEQRLPQCLIIGNYKSGTQELLEFMYMHPRIRIYREPLFELNFFGGKNYENGLDWYKKQMPCSYTGQITVEKSPSYFQEPAAPTNIYAMDPKIKLIVLVREPIARALAHFSYSKHIAKRYDNKFDNCAIDSKTGDITKDCFFIKHSVYDEGMERYLRLFDQSQIMVVDSVDFKNNPFKVLHRIETFLEIEHIIDENQFVYIKEKGFYCIRSVQDSQRVTCYDQKRGRSHDNTGANNLNINTATKKKLLDFFRPRNERLFQLIGQRFDWQYEES